MEKKFLRYISEFNNDMNDRRAILSSDTIYIYISISKRDEKPDTKTNMKSRQCHVGKKWSAPLQIYSFEGILTGFGLLREICVDI